MFSLRSVVIVDGAMWKWFVAVLLASSEALDQIKFLCTHQRCRYVNYNSRLGYIYKVDGQSIRIIYDRNQTLTIDCDSANVLDSPALPHANVTLSVSDVELRYCPPPAVGSLSDTLTTLNVTLYGDDSQARGKLSLYKLPPAPPLTAKHFIGLERLVYLDIYAIRSASASPAAGFLAPLKNLRTLSMWNVELPDGELAAAPPSLRTLNLSSARVERLPAPIHASTSLRELTIHSRRALDAVAVPPSLTVLELDSPATALLLDAVPALETLSLSHWTDVTPPPLTCCDALRELHLNAPAVKLLPNGWLTNCSRLEKLDVQHAINLTALPTTLLRGNALTHLTFAWGSLELLPAELLRDLPNLRTLILNDNNLRTIPSGMFAVARGVQTLDLSSNKLDSGAMIALAPLEDLTELNLKNNPSFGDVCETGGYSPIKNSENLTKFSLLETSVTRICRDWRQNMPRLEMLELGRTKLTSLTFEDLQFRRIVKGQVWLADAPVTVVEMTREDFNNAGSTQPSGARMYFHGRYNTVALACDCRMYWTRRALERHPHAFDSIDELRCDDGKLLREMPPEDMVCLQPEECRLAELPDECACAVRPDDDTSRDRRLVRVRCEHAALRRVPRPHDNSSDKLYELLLANNNITDLHADDLHNVKGLDLTNNSLSTVDEETASRLGRIGGVVRLAGNPLDCNCSAAPLLRALHSRAPADSDIGEAKCRDGTALYAAPTANCSQTLSAIQLAWLTSLLAALLAVALATVACLASRERRFFVKAVLHRWGVWRPTEEDDGRCYAAYVTFSHEDEAVVREIIARLEPAHRLCIHYRDWVPGLLIFEQIVESVRNSRRTIALVSRHFLASSWARAEFREAHTSAMMDSRPRLIVVLLEDPAMLPLDDLLQRYLKTNTYVRWGDPWFWDKLLLALSTPRQKPSNVKVWTANRRPALAITGGCTVPLTAPEAETAI